MEYSFLLGSLENILGKSHKTSKDNYAFYCPVCNHRKPKLEIDLHTNEKGENHFACWVCGTKGKTIRSLLTQLKVSKIQATDILKLVPRGEQHAYEEIPILELPKEFQPLYNSPETSIPATIVKKYLLKRGLTNIDFLRYNIGYCTNGEYAGRIIIPSYDEHNQLNFFTGRSYDGNYYKYKNPGTSKDIVFFENLINWNKPIILCEGPFDALAIRRNAVPLQGKLVSKALLLKILSSPLNDIYIALDKDALKEALYFCEKFLNMGKRVFLIDMEEKDPSEMGFESFTKKIQQAKELDFGSLIHHKLELV